jgi:formylglycine-generating enzyme required for sulfatase activity
MGSTGFYPEEGPVTAAEVESLWVDDHPVTNAAFRRFVACARPSAAKSCHPAEAEEMPRV